MPETQLQGEREQKFGAGIVAVSQEAADATNASAEYLFHSSSSRLFPSAVF